MDNNEIITNKNFLEKQLKTFFYKYLVNIFINIDAKNLYNFTLIDAHEAYMKIVNNEIQDINDLELWIEPKVIVPHAPQTGWMKRVIEQAAIGNRHMCGAIGPTGPTGATGCRGATGAAGCMGYRGPIEYNNWELKHPLTKKFANKITVQFSLEQFFVYCYYPNYHDDSISDKILEYQCNKHNLYTFNGFSPLGAAMISNVDNYTKRNFIFKLLENGIIMTEKDLLLAKYLLFESQVTEINPIAKILLCGFDILNYDVKRYILEIMIEHHKQNFYITF
jgi:hypothetical protein